MALYQLLALGLLLPLVVLGQNTWCGKHYMKGSPIVAPGGLFQAPETSHVPLLNLQCSPSIKPYLAGENVSLIVDTRITSLKVPGAAPFTNPHNAKSLHISVSINGQTHALGTVAFNSTGTELSLPIHSLVPRKQPYVVTCIATLPGSSPSTFKTTTQLHYLELPSKGSVTKQDFRTGSLLVKNGSSWEPFFPIGFYTSFDGYLSNVSNVDAIKARGLNVIHPVPTFDNMTAFGEALDRMEELGLWLMYDMRFTYMNKTSVTEQVNMIKDRPNLLLWYTGDEPDGTSDPLNATKVTYDLINDLDGGYHPVSLVLNCQDYFFSEYSLGADIILQDTYPIDINATFSRVWGTPCTPDYGDCGCDNCKGNMQDISTRVDEFKQRLDLLGRSRNTAVWSVPQAFGVETYWPRYPTGQEWLVQSILGINHGSLGILPWDDPTSADIVTASSALAAAVPRIVPFLSTPKVKFTPFQHGNVDGATWTLPGGKQTLLLVANPNEGNVSVVLNGITSGTATEILNGGASLAAQNGGAVLTLGPMSTTGWILQDAEVTMAALNSL